MLLKERSIIPLMTERHASYELHRLKNAKLEINCGINYEMITIPRC